MVLFSMSRGGKRKGAGGVSTWNSGKTKVIRVPIALAEQVLSMARQLDSSDAMFEPVTTSNIAPPRVIDLSGVSVTHANGEIAVKLEDLVALGFQIQPSSLAVMVDARIRRKYRR